MNKAHEWCITLNGPPLLSRFLTSIAPIPRRVVQVPVLAEEDVPPVVVHKRPADVEVPPHLPVKERGGGGEVAPCCLVLCHDGVAAAAGAVVSQAAPRPAAARTGALRAGQGERGRHGHGQGGGWEEDTDTGRAEACARHAG